MSKTPRLRFELIYKKLALPLTKFIVKRAGGDQNTVEEVLSRTWIAAWKGWDTFENKSSYFTWLCRISLNKIADYYREEIHRNSLFVAPILEELAHYDSRQMSPEEWYVLNELCNSVKACVKLLPTDKQRLLFLRYWKGLAIKQIASEFGTSERSVEGKIYRAKQLLKEILSVENPHLTESYLRLQKK